MDPINKKERSRATWKVIGLFVISLILALLPFYKTLTQPQSEKKILNKDLQEVNKQLEFQQTYFSPKITEASEMLTQLDDPEANHDVINGKIGNLISEMERNIDAQQNAEKWQSKMYQNIKQTYSNYHNEKKELLTKEREIGETSADAQRGNVELQRALDQVRTLKADLQIAKSNTSSSSSVELNNLKTQNADIIRQYKRMQKMVNSAYGSGSVPDLKL